MNSVTLTIFLSVSLCLAATQHVRLSVLRLRGHLPDQHPRAALPDESLLRWRVSYLWTASAQSIRYSAGGTCGSYGLYIPARY